MTEDDERWTGVDYLIWIIGLTALTVAGMVAYSIALAIGRAVL